jgi:hypothetical protein
MTRTTIAPGLNLVYGSYRGDGIDGHIIECGFSPDLVIIRPATTQHSVFRTSAHVGDNTSYLATNVANLANAIQSFSSKGFTVGTHATVNSAGIIYHFIAIKDSGLNNFAVGTYTGNGIDNRNITALNFQPDLVWIKRNGASNSVFRDSLDVGDVTHYGINSNAIADAIQSILSNGFQVGSATEVNNNGQTYYYFALKASAKFVISSYEGDGTNDRNITGVGFDPDIVLVKRDGGVGEGGSSPILKTKTMIGDLSGTLANANLAADIIQSLITDGFQVGTNTSVNATTAPTTYHFFAFISNRMRVVVP